jgi:hypothetical protein
MVKELWRSSIRGPIQFVLMIVSNNELTSPKLCTARLGDENIFAVYRDLMSVFMLREEIPHTGDVYKFIGGGEEIRSSRSVLPSYQKPVDGGRLLIMANTL